MSPNIRFTKMHGLGNDFVIINALKETIDLKQLPIKELANRYTGIGFDQLLVIGPGKKGDFFCRIFNADGSEAEQCGNGLRCVARFIHEEKIHLASSFTLETIAGSFPVSIKNYDHVKVAMGIPLVKEKMIELPLLNSKKLAVSVITTGNPHAVIKVDSVDEIPIEKLGAEISTHSYFPHGVNVGFMQVLSSNHARLRTFERGIGETAACGSNACAAAVAGTINGWLKKQPIMIEFHNGNLLLEWDGEGQPIYMTGPAARIFSGEIHSVK